MRLFESVALIIVLPTVVAQLPVPSPPWLPPNAASGAIPSPPLLPPPLPNVTAGTNATAGTNMTAGAQTSPGITPNAQWSTLLGNLLYFYEAQRSGKLPSNNRVPWRNDSALSDGQDAGVDLSGGYFDAGDYVKCTFPLSFTLMSVCWGAMDFGTGYNNANQTAYLDAMLRWGLDWLIKAHPNPRTLFVQVGDTNTDNNYWGGDIDVPGPRPSFQINDTSPGTDAAAQAAAAFAACSLLYANQTLNTSSAFPASLSNTSYSQTLRIHAEQLYDFAVHASGGSRNYQVSVPEVGNTYASTSYGDDLTIAGLFLALANTTSTTSPFTSEMYYNQALNFWSTSSLSHQNGVFNWDNKTPALAVLFAQIAKIRSDLGSRNVTMWKSEAERYFDHILSNQGPGILTDGGLLWYDGDSDEASLNPALNAAMLMARYAPLTSDLDKRASYLNFVQNQLDYVLGKNPMSVPYVVGLNPNSPSNPHTAMASGGNDINAINTDPQQEAYILYGGIVGGPNKKDLFYDIRSDWVETEISLDYAAPMLTLAAYSILTNPNDPYFTSLKAGEYEKHKPTGQPCDAALPCKTSHGLSKAAKIAIGVLTGVVGLILVILLLKWLWHCRKSRKKYIA